MSSAVAIDAFIPLVTTGGTAANSEEALIIGATDLPEAVLPPIDVQPVATELPIAPPAAPLSLTAGTYESDNASVIKTWGWSPISNAAASGGSALMSGDSADSLTIMFEGSTITTIFAGNSATGEIALELDGQIVQQINTNNATETYGMAATIEDLTASIHTLRILPVNGATIIVDAFVIGASMQQQPEIPVVATDVPVEILPPVATELPIELPPAVSGTLGFDNTEAGTVSWMTAGGWQLAHDDTNAAVGYFWQTVTPDNSADSLTWLTPFDLTSVQRPMFTFQSWLQAPNSLGWIEVSTDGINWQQVTTVTSSDTWTPITVDLSAFAGQARINVRFLWQQGVTTDAPNVWHVDDVTLANTP